jgi:hypothetical protein
MMALLMPLIHFTSANAAVFDLKSDWSNTANPNGVWSYNEGANPLPHQDVLGSPYCVSDKQSGWGPSNGRQAPPPPFLPLWFKAVQSSPSDSYGNIEDWEAGDIVTHSQDDGNGKDKGKSNVTFTFPGPNPGFANISGSVWIARDIGRAVGWALYHNGKLLTEGSLYGGDPNVRDRPLIIDQDRPLSISYK